MGVGSNRKEIESQILVRSVLAIGKVLCLQPGRKTEKMAVLGERSDAYLVQNPNLKVNKNNTVCPQNWVSC